MTTVKTHTCSKTGEIAELQTNQEYFKMTFQELKSDMKDIRDYQGHIMSKIDSALDTKADKSAFEEHKKNIGKLIFKITFSIFTVFLGTIGYLLNGRI